MLMLLLFLTFHHHFYHHNHEYSIFSSTFILTLALVRNVSRFYVVLYVRVSKFKLAKGVCVCVEGGRAQFEYYMLSHAFCGFILLVQSIMACISCSICGGVYI